MRGRFIATIMVGVLLLGGAGYLLAHSGAITRISGRMGEELRTNLLVLTFANPIFYLGTVLILLAERRWPAQVGQKSFSIGFKQDLVWLFFESILHATVLTVYAAALRALYRAYFGFLTIHSSAAMPAWARFCLAVLLIDFLAYVHHWVRHKVGIFWLFHTVHHSQRELNLFTDMRYHIVEYVIAHTVRFVPLLALNLNPPEILGYLLAHQWYTRFCHGNIRTNLGPLRFILVTPQSHRVHHSPHRRHWDVNFGVIFSVWDRLFGTHYRNDREYPRTGIPDHDFPVEESAGLAALFWTPIRQHIYPFMAMVRDSRRDGESITIEPVSSVDETSLVERNVSCDSPSSAAFSQSG